MNISSITVILTVCMATIPYQLNSKTPAIKANTNISAYSLHYDFHQMGNGKKKVLFLASNLPESLEDSPLYKNHDIVVLKEPCSVVTAAELKKITRRSKFLRVGGFLSLAWYAVTSNSTVFFGNKAFSLVSNNNIAIDIYLVKIVMNDAKHYATTHPGTIAILIDEHDNVVCILDNVESSDDVLKGFGIK